MIAKIFNNKLKKFIIAYGIYKLHSWCVTCLNQSTSTKENTENIGKIFDNPLNAFILLRIIKSNRFSHGCYFETSTSF